MTITNRKMGGLEKVTALIHDNFTGSCSVAAILKVNNILAFDLFKQAWHVLFLRHPLLRVLPKIKDNEYFLDESMSFNNVPIKHIVTDNFNHVEQEYSRDILKPFDSRYYFWRASLAVMPEKKCSYVIFAAPHTICDGKSLSWLLSDLLQIILELKQNKIPDITSYAMPLAIDELLDYEQFSITDVPPVTLAPAKKFASSATIETSISENILMQVAPHDLQKYLTACRQHQVTLNGALNAAFALSIYDIENRLINDLNLCMVFDLRTRTKKFIHPRELAFYAHQAMIHVELSPQQDFWGLVQQIRLKEKQAIKDYKLPPVDDEEFMEEVITNWKNSLSKQEFTLPYAISNIGVVDAAYENVKAHYDIESFYFTISQQAMPYAFIIFAATVSGNLCLDFNFAMPACTKEKAEKIVRRIIYYMDSNCIIT